MANPQLLFEPDKQYFFRDFFEGNEIILIQEKSDPYEIYVSTESFAKVMGYKSAQDMLSDNDFLDKINEYMNSSGNPFPIKNYKSHD